MIETISKVDKVVFAIADNPFAEEFSEFRTSSRNWLSIWLYVCESCDDLLTEDLHVSEKTSITLAKRLQTNLEDGSFEQWKQKWNSLSQKNECDESILTRFISFCGFSGGFQV
jgi:hypothetical protein